MASDSEDRPQVGTALRDVRADNWARSRPRLRLRLRTVLLTLSLSVLVLPVASLQILRIYESVLIRQTQGSLVAQSAFVVAAYRAALTRETGSPVGSYGRPFDGRRPAPAAALDLAESEMLPPLAGGLGGRSPDAVAARVGATLGGVLRDAAAVTGAQVRVFDADGVVVATTRRDIGLSLAHNDEVGEALAGRGRNSLRRVAVEPLPITAISRNTAIRVHVARPVVVDGRLVGGVLVSRSPSTILAALYDKRWLLIQAAGLVLAVVVGIALVAARTLVLPVRRLGRAAGRLARHETSRFDGGRPYRVIELAELAASVEAMAESLQQRARYVRDFARHVNHEFKTPIAAMRGAVELLREHVDTMSEDETRRFLGNLDDDIERLERLTMRLLELADADMAGPTDEVVDVLEVAKGLDRPEVHVAEDAPSARVHIASASIEAVLQNLVDNAVECGAGRVDVRAAVEGETVVVDVADDGPGISPGNQARVFEPFFTTRRDVGGTGLGLPISRSLVRHAGGELELASARKGTSFRITLPAEGVG